MTSPRFGRITPLQTSVIAVGGRGVDDYQPSTVDELVSAMLSEVAYLRYSTGRDFGFDVEAWHNYLLQDPDLSRAYRHPYAWTRVLAEVQRLIRDPGRPRLVAMAQEAERRRTLPGPT